MLAMNRVNKYGLRFFFMEINDNQTEVRHDGKVLTFNVSIQAISQGWYNWMMKDELIQVAFPFLLPEQREFLKTGITPEKWAEIFSEEER